jgi:hypothetical protein
MDPLTMMLARSEWDRAVQRAKEAPNNLRAHALAEEDRAFVRYLETSRKVCHDRANVSA